MGGTGSGRRPKPLETRLAEGAHNNGYALNSKKYDAEKLTTVPSTELANTVTVPVCPSELGERGQAEWDKIWTAGWQWLAPDHDFRQVEMIAQAYDEIDRANALITRFEKTIEQDGDTVEDRFGALQEHPLYKAIDRQRANIDRQRMNITKWLSIHAFSPTDRARLQIVINKAKIGLAKADAIEKKDPTEVQAEAGHMAWDDDD